MTRVALLLLLACTLTGCTAPPAATDDPTITADLAVEGAKAVVRASGTFAPSPAPNPNKTCENCGGTGKLGDGHIVTTCPICKGTGVRR